jgi:hypothetical protein
LAEIDRGLQCVTVLPDRRTLRFVWGDPRRAEDLEIDAGRRQSSSLLPTTYAEGCPDVSPDGRRLVYPGRTADGLPFASGTSSSIAWRW